MNVRGMVLSLLCALVISSFLSAQQGCSCVKANTYCSFGGRANQEKSSSCGASAYDCACPKPTFNFSSMDSTLRVRGSRQLHIPVGLCMGEGTLDIHDDSIVKPGRISFDGGRLILNGNLSDSRAFCCLSQLTTSPLPVVELLGDDLFRSEVAVFPLPIKVRNCNNRLEGSVLFAIASDSEHNPGILLIGPDVDLTVALQSTVNSFIGMECGTLILDSDLQFEAGKSIVGMGTVDLHGHLLSFGGGDLGTSHAIRWINGSGIILNADTRIGSMWLFGPSLYPARIDGNGAFLDISGTGSLLVEPDVQLTLQNLVLRDFGPHAIGLVDATSVVRLCNTTIILTQDTVYDQGTFLVDSPNVRIITGSHTLSFRGDAKLIIDGVTLACDTLNCMNGASIIFGDKNVNLELRNCGTIQCQMSTLKQESDHLILEGNYDFSNTDFIDVDACMILEGNGHIIDFSQEKAGGIRVRDRSKISTTSVTFRGFRPEHLLLEGDGSCVFSNNTTLELGKPLCRSVKGLGAVALPRDYGVELDYVWTFEGNGRSVLDLGGGTLQLNKGGQLRVVGNGGLLIKNGTITGLRRQNIHLEQPESTLMFEDVTLKLDQNFNFNKGILSLGGLVTLQGPGRVFCFSSDGHVFVQSSSVLKFDQGTIFRYSPSSNDRHKILFADKTSTLSLKESTIHTTCKNGMLLTTGSIEFEGKVTLRNDYELDQPALRIDCFLKQYKVPMTSIKTSGAVILQKDIARKLHVS